jgi:hypothetical protein
LFSETARVQWRGGTKCVINGTRWPTHDQKRIIGHDLAWVRAANQTRGDQYRARLLGSLLTFLEYDNADGFNQNQQVQEE